jgi:hypothetical protein
MLVSQAYSKEQYDCQVAIPPCHNVPMVGLREKMVSAGRLDPTNRPSSKIKSKLDKASRSRPRHE